MRKKYKYLKDNSKMPLLVAEDGDIFKVEEIAAMLGVPEDEVVELGVYNPNCEEPNSIEDLINPDIFINEFERLNEEGIIEYKTYYYLGYNGREIQVYTYYCHFIFAYMKKDDFEFILNI